MAESNARAPYTRAEFLNFKVQTFLQNLIVDLLNILVLRVIINPVLLRLLLGLLTLNISKFILLFQQSNWTYTTSSVKYVPSLLLKRRSLTYC